MRLLALLLSGLFIVSCSGDEAESTESTTGMVKEIEPNQSELDEIALADQPQLIQDFFALKTNIIGDGFCYDHEAISQMILHDNPDVKDWSKFDVTNNYLTLYNSQCDVMLEFMTWEEGEDKYAFLSQMTRSMQQFNVLQWNANQNTWRNKVNYPKPDLEAYFDNLTNEEADLVIDYGFDFVYINPGSKSATFVFSKWATQMNMGEKEMLEFHLEPAYTFDLISTPTGLDLVASPIESAQNDSQNYFVAYTKNAEPDFRFEKQYEVILTSFTGQDLQSQIVQYGSNNFKVFFHADTFDFQYMEQFEPRDGFWFYQKGQEPLDLGANEPIDEVMERAHSYFLGLEL